jgi:hypothetical protein
MWKADRQCHSQLTYDCHCLHFVQPFFLLKQLLRTQAAVSVS